MMMDEQQIITLQARQNEARQERERIPDRLVRLASTDELNAIKAAELTGFILGLDFALMVMIRDVPVGGASDVFCNK